MSAQTKKAQWNMNGSNSTEGMVQSTVKSLDTQETATTSLRQECSFFVEALERLQAARRTIKLSDPESYIKLRVNSTLQYCREDWGGITSLRYSSTGDRIAVGFNSGDLQLRKVPGMSLLDKKPNTLSVFKGWEGNHAISCIRFHPRNVNLLYCSSTSGVIWRLTISDKIFSDPSDFIIEEDGNEIFSFDFDMNGARFITAGKDSIVRVYDSATEKMLSRYGSLIKSCQLDEDERDLSVVSNQVKSRHLGWNWHKKRIYCVRSHPEEPNIFVTGGWDRIVKVWDLRTPSGCVRNIAGPFIWGEAIDICKGKILTASCVASNSLQLWDLGSGELVMDISPTNRRVQLHGEYPYVAQFYRGDNSGDLVLLGVGGVQIISIKESSVLYIFEDQKPVLAVDSSQEKIASGGKSHSILFANICLPEEESGHSIEISASASDYASDITNAE